jgi:hypothetical protein
VVFMCGVAYLAYIVACRVADPLVWKLRDQVMMTEEAIYLDMTCFLAPW